MQVLLTASDGDIEKPALIGFRSTEAEVAMDGLCGHKMPDITPTSRTSWKMVLHELRNEDNWPLQAFSAVDGQNLHSIKRNELLFRSCRLAIGFLRLMLKKARERVIFLDRARMKIDGLKVRDSLAELAKVIEDDWPTAIWHQFLSEPDPF